MGEAKARGTFEQRKAAAQERNKAARSERLKSWLTERNKTPEQKLRERDAEIAMAQILSMSAPYMVINNRRS